LVFFTFFFPDFSPTPLGRRAFRPPAKVSLLPFYLVQCKFWGTWAIPAGIRGMLSPRSHLFTLFLFFPVPVTGRRSKCFPPPPLSVDPLDPLPSFFSVSEHVRQSTDPFIGPALKNFGFPHFLSLMLDPCFLCVTFFFPCRNPPFFQAFDNPPPNSFIFSFLPFSPQQVLSWFRDRLCVLLPFFLRTIFALFPRLFVACFSFYPPHPTL